VCINCIYLSETGKYDILRDILTFMKHIKFKILSGHLIIAILSRVDTKIFVFEFSRKFREKSLRKVAKNFAKIFTFAKVFHLKCSSRSMGQLNVYLDPKHLWALGTARYFYKFSTYSFKFRRCDIPERQFLCVFMLIRCL
jgi:hypothetical protein